MGFATMILLATPLVQMSDSEICRVARREATENKSYEGPWPFELGANCRRLELRIRHRTKLYFDESGRTAWAGGMQEASCKNEFMRELIRRGWKISYTVENDGPEMKTEISTCS